jgi:CRISPR/Cas system-associated protein Cas7 (RAMP superfamily)
MEICLFKAEKKDAGLVHAMRIKSFKSLLERYQDFETNPSNEPVENVIERLNQTSMDFYLIQKDGIMVGAISVGKLGDRRYRISPVFVLPEYQGKLVEPRSSTRK